MPNDGSPLAPGKGTIPWQATLVALRESGYAGSLDIEFRCGPDRAIQEYEQALRLPQPLAQ